MKVDLNLQGMYIMGSNFSYDTLQKHINPSTIVDDAQTGKINIIMENCLPDIVIGKVVQVYEDDTFLMITMNNLHSTLSFTPYHVRIIDAPIFIRNSLSKLLLGRIVKLKNISIDSEGALLSDVFLYTTITETNVTTLISSHSINGILYMQEKDRRYGDNIPHIT